MMMQQKNKRTPQVDQLSFTLTYQLIKATEELLDEVLSAGYEGYVKIIANINHENRSKAPVLLDVRLEKLGSKVEWSMERLRKCCLEANCAVFDVVQGKGCKRIAV